MIRDDIKFIGYRAFYNKKDRVKEHYKKLNREDKTIYKYYVYSRRQLKECTCDLIWRFLNDDMEDEEYTVTETMLKDECYKYRM
jgi:hypothetical protein